MSISENLSPQWRREGDSLIIGQGDKVGRYLLKSGQEQIKDEAIIDLMLGTLNNAGTHPETQNKIKNLIGGKVTQTNIGAFTLEKASTPSRTQGVFSETIQKSSPLSKPSISTERADKVMSYEKIGVKLYLYMDKALKHPFTIEEVTPQNTKVVKGHSSLGAERLVEDVAGQLNDINLKHSSDRTESDTEVLGMIDKALEPRKKNTEAPLIIIKLKNKHYRLTPETSTQADNASIKVRQDRLEKFPPPTRLPALPPVDTTTPPPLPLLPSNKPSLQDYKNKPVPKPPAPAEKPLDPKPTPPPRRDVNQNKG